MLTASLKGMTDGMQEGLHTATECWDLAVSSFRAMNCGHTFVSPRMAARHHALMSCPLQLQRCHLLPLLGCLQRSRQLALPMLSTLEDTLGQGAWHRAKVSG